MAVTIDIAPEYTTYNNQSMVNGGEFSAAEMGKETISGTGDGRIPFPLPTDTQNLSSACRIVKITTEFEYSCYTSSSYVSIIVDFYTRVRCFDSNKTLLDSAEEKDYEGFGSKKASDNSWSSKVHNWACDLETENIKYIGTLFKFVRNSSGDIYPWFKVKAKIRHTKIGYTRTRACYITFKNDDGATLQAKKVYDYGANPSCPTPSKTGYNFVGWKSSLDNKTYTTLPKAGEVDVTYTAVWSVRTDIPYTVKYFFQLLPPEDDIHESLPADDEILTGTAGAAINITPKEIPGFTFKSMSDNTSGKIAADGSTVVWLHYDRKIMHVYAFTNPAGKTPNKILGSYDPETLDAIDYYYGESVTLTAVPGEGYRFVRWHDDLTDPVRTVVLDDPDIVYSYVAYFELIPPEITSVQFLYNSKQVSETNKVPAGEHFIIAVGVK